MPTGVTRGCGKRQQGGAYLEVPTGPHGKPVEAFLLDPPVKLDPRNQGLSPVGVTLFQDERGKEAEPGVPLMHVLDWVGAESYPNVADVVEEVRRFGLSRRISRTANFRGLGYGSKIFLAHARALITNPVDHYVELRVNGTLPCPKEKHNLAELEDSYGAEPPEPVECCAGLWWRDVEDGFWSAGVIPGERHYVRSIGDTTYNCFPPAVKSSYQLGLFAVFPLAKIAVIRAADGSHELTEHAVGQGKLPVSLEDE